VLLNSDFEAVVNLRATCQLARTAVDDVVKTNSRLRRSIGENRKADLWTRKSAKPHTRDVEVAYAKTL
jgi:enamine deaminase RidA (YjgF/YER057c/UK114 family)